MQNRKPDAIWGNTIISILVCHRVNEEEFLDGNSWWML